ncbi:MAG: nucleotidyltransferase domain-containing protein [Acidobacteriota bacterium]
MQFLRPHEKQVLEELKQSIEEFLGPELERIVLFGSKARGDAEPGSDLDVAILVRDLSAERKRQILNVVAQIELEHLFPISALVLSVNDFEILKSRERRIALDIEREGIPL